jgi:branched-subunit amino acid ABC-type transport system permease component
MVATIGVSIVIQQLTIKMFTARAQPYPTPAALEQRISLGPVQFDYLNLLILGLALGLMVVLAVVLRRSRPGISIRAVAENPQVATLMGMTGADRYACFRSQCAPAGIAGVLGWND